VILNSSNIHYLYNVNSVLVAVLILAVRSKAWVCGRWIAGIAGSIPAEGMDVCLLRVLCVVR